MFAGSIYLVFAAARMSASAAEAVGQCCAGRQKAMEAGKKTNINVGATMVTSKWDTTQHLQQESYEPKT